MSFVDLQRIGNVLGGFWIVSGNEDCPDPGLAQGRDGFGGIWANGVAKGNQTEQFCAAADGDHRVALGLQPRDPSLLRAQVYLVGHQVARAADQHLGPADPCRNPQARRRLELSNIGRSDPFGESRCDHGFAQGVF